MKRLFTPQVGKIAKGVSLAVLQLAAHTLELVPVPGAESGISAVLDVIKGIDVSIMRSCDLQLQAISAHCVPLSLAQKTKRNQKTLVELENHVQLLTEILEPLAKLDPLNISSGLKDDISKFNK
jgi:hypothetical protein